MVKRVFVVLAALVGLFGPTAVQAAEWRVPGDFATIPEAITAAAPGDTIFVGAGFHHGAIVDKAVEIRGEGGAVINDGPSPLSNTALKTGFFFPAGNLGNGATITHLRFEGVQFPVFSRGANDVTVSHNVMVAPWLNRPGFVGEPLV